MTITIQRIHVVLVVVLILQIVLVAYLRGWFNDYVPSPEPPTPPAPISALQTLTPTECVLVRGAINLILREWSDFRNVAGVLEALRSGVPQYPRDTRPIVMEAFGVPPNLGAARERLMALEGELPH